MSLLNIMWSKLSFRLVFYQCNGLKRLCVVCWICFGYKLRRYSFARLEYLDKESVSLPLYFSGGPQAFVDEMTRLIVEIRSWSLLFEMSLSSMYLTFWEIRVLLLKFLFWKAAYALALWPLVQHVSCDQCPSNGSRHWGNNINHQVSVVVGIDCWSNASSGIDACARERSL